MIATLPATGSVLVSAPGKQVLLRDRAGLDLAGSLGSVDGFAGVDLLDHPQHLDGVVALVGAGVSSADVQEHQQGAQGGDHCCDDEQDSSAIHER